MTEEAKFQKKIITYMESIGAFVTKFNASGISKTGVPDLLMCYKGRYLALEVKKESGTISDIQQWNLNQIRKAGGEAVCIKPSDFEEFKKHIIEEEYFMIRKLCERNEKEITKLVS